MLFRSVHHEYGHNVVEKGASGQGAYGEGMGDVHAVLMTEDPRLGVGFQTCSTGIRNAANTCQYSSSGCSSCGSEIHACGQLISGCVWDLRNRLATAYPSTWQGILRRLVINSMPLHGAIGTIATDITIDYLTLDDDDGTLANGTPNYNSINTAFSIHGLPGPGLSPLLFTYPNGVPTSVGHYGFTPLVVQVDPLSSQPNLNTVRLYSKATTASTWTDQPDHPCGTAAELYVTVGLPSDPVDRGRAATLVVEEEPPLSTYAYDLLPEPAEPTWQPVEPDPSPQPVQSMWILVTFNLTRKQRSLPVVRS